MAERISLSIATIDCCRQKKTFFTLFPIEWTTLLSCGRCSHADFFVLHAGHLPCFRLGL